MHERAAGGPDVVVSIVNASRRDTLLPLLASLEPELDGPLAVEVVVLDNASDDGSADAVRERFPWARVIEQRHRAGFGANHNRVIRETTGRYVVLLSHDAEWHPGELAPAIAYLDDHPAVGALAPRIRYPDGRVQASAWRFPTPLVSLLGTLTAGRAGVVQSRDSGPRRVDWAMGAALLLRRAALEAAGGFDERFFMYSEETDLLRRFAQLGYETHFFPAVTVVHHESAMRAAVPRERIAEEWRSRHAYWRKHHSPAGARVAAAATAVQYGVRAAAATLLLRDRELAARMRLHARSAWRGPQGPGLRELVEGWNREHAREPEPARR
jgi:N-acetylglucosaminyl-diphospho-decaprenol L-rhamnosyltransferase